MPAYISGNIIFIVLGITRTLSPLNCIVVIKSSVSFNLLNAVVNISVILLILLSVLFIVKSFVKSLDKSSVIIFGVVFGGDTILTRLIPPNVGISEFL